MMNRAFGILLALTFVVSATPMANAASSEAITMYVPISGDGEIGTDATISCGGTAPLTTSCSATTTLNCCSIGMSIIPGLGFTGTITNRISSATAAHTFSCNITLWGTPFQSFSCTFSGSGFYYIGQTATLRGTTSATSVGDWTVRLNN